MNNSLIDKHENLRQAEGAVTYVKQKMVIGASNKSSDLFTSLFEREWSMTCVERIRKEPYSGATIISKLRAIAQRASINGCGNCGEQAAIAFVWLMNKKISPIDYMSRTNADHAFVVIGREGDLKNPDSWGDNCYVCDPWDGTSYAIKDASKKMYGGGVLTPRSVARWEG